MRPYPLAMTRRVALAAAATLIALTGCASKTPSATPSADTVLSPTAAASPTAMPTSTSKSSPSATAAPTGPTILYFRVKVKPSCSGEGPGGTFGGHGAELEWSAINVDQVIIGVDGPGQFGVYDPKFSHEFPFACGSSPGTYKHKYVLRTVGGGPEKTQTIELEAKKN